MDLSRTRSPSASELTAGAGRDPLTDQVTSRAQFLSKTWYRVGRGGGVLGGDGGERESQEEVSSEH